MQFFFEAQLFNGFNPENIPFQRQSNVYTCWAACLANARSLLHGQTNVTDQDIIRAANLEEYQLQAVMDRELEETIMFVSHLTQVFCARQATAETPSLWELPEALEAVSQIVSRGENPRLFLIALRSPDPDEPGHMVLLLAHGGVTGMSYLVYDPYVPDDARGNTLYDAIRVFGAVGGLRILSYETLRNYGQYAVPLLPAIRM